MSLKDAHSQKMEAQFLGWGAKVDELKAAKAEAGAKTNTASNSTP